MVNTPTAKLKVKSLAALRKRDTENPTMPVNTFKNFKHLVIFTQRENNLEVILAPIESIN